jgi:Flp pilus assembly protein TadG
MMNLDLRRAAWTRRGQALVELALILPAILLLVVGMLEFARAWNLHQVMTDAAREGARRAVLADANMDQDSVRAAMWRHLAQFGYDPGYSSIMSGTTITPIDSFKHSGANITVQLSLPYRFFILPGMAITMRTAFTMRNE